MEIFNTILIILTVICTLLFQFLLIFYMRPRKSEQLDELIKKFEAATEPKDSTQHYAITKDELDAALQTVAYGARKEAADEYKNNFSILLSVLAVFGIALPVAMTFMNFKFNEGELKKIEKAVDTANKAVKIVKDANNDAENAKKKADEASNTANDAIDLLNATSKKAKEAYEKATNSTKELVKATKRADEAANTAKKNNEETVKLQKEVYSEFSTTYSAIAVGFCDKKQWYPYLMFWFRAVYIKLKAINKFNNDKEYCQNCLKYLDVLCNLVLGQDIDELAKKEAKNCIVFYDALLKEAKKMPDDLTAKKDKDKTISKKTIVEKLQKIIEKLK